ncbi:MAG: hypothetical protein JNK05_14210 [Myxococcales bacterium]|nr:hypothetical protein [Myxococcales bacterium]
MIHTHDSNTTLLARRTQIGALAMLVACARPVSTTPTRARPTPMRTTATFQETQDAADAPATPAGGCDTSAHPAITDYTDIVAGRAFSLLVRREASGAWVPAQPLRMPMHHASTIVFEPSLDTLVSDAGAATTWLVLATGLGRRSLDHDPRRHTWFATYAARPERVCPQ